MGEPIRLGPWTGMNNRARDYAIDQDKVRNAVNVVFDNSGHLHTRPGLARDYNGHGCHSFYCCPLGRFFVEGGVLKRHVGTDLALPLRNVAGHVAYVYAYDGNLYCSDNASNWYITPTLTVQTWGDPIPDTNVDFDTANYDEYPQVYDVPPPGTMLRIQAGRIFIVRGSEVYYTEPYAYGLIRTRNVIPFESNVTVFEPVSDGFWAATETTTWWLQGLEPSHYAEQMQTINPQLNYGGVFGSAVQVPNDNDVMWMSPRGVIRASPGGQLVNLQEDHVGVSPADSGVSLIYEADGHRHFISTINPTGQSPFAESTWLANEIARKA